MKKPYLLLTLAWLAYCTSINAQITVTNSVFPVVGDTLHYLIGNQPGAINQIFTPPGGPQNWDLSNLQPSQVWDQIIKDPQTGTAAASFPGASVLFNPLNSSSEVYWQVTGTQVLDMGYFGLDELGLGLNLLFKKTPALEQSWAPVNFFDIHQSASNVLTAFDAPIAPPVLLNLVPTADSFRIRVTYQRIATIDAFGILAIPGGSFDVLRKKQTEYKSMAVDVKVAPLGWIDISTIGGQQLLPLGTDTITTFHFLNDVSKEPVAICTLNTAQNEVISVQYKAVNTSLPAPLISSIDDGDADDRAAVGDTLTYTITFNEDIDATTVTAADFDNAGTATISIGVIIETAPGVFTVKVRPTSAGTLILRIPSGAIIADLDGNNLVVPVLDNTTICIPPSIINQPASDSVFTNQTASFFVVASGSGTLSYNWEVLPAGGAVWMDVAPALDGNDTLIVGPVAITNNGNQYRVVISDSASPSCQPITSNVANLTVLPGPIVGDADTTGQAIGDIIDQFLMETQDPPKIYDPCTCRNNTGIIPSGTFTDDGLFDDEIIVVSPTAGNTWEIAAGTIFPFATNANPSAQPGDLTRVTVGTPLTFIGSVNTMEGVRYIYRLQIIHKDNEGYDVTVRETSNPLYANLLLPIGNRCYYPTPAINGLDATYCVGEPAVTLMGSVDRGDGQTAATPESAVFSIDNNPVVQFDPQTLGAGTFTVVYTVDAAAEGATIPGCMQAVSQQVSINSAITINPLMPRTTCLTKKVVLADLFKGVVYVGDPTELRYTWTIKEPGNLNGILEGLDAGNPASGTYTPGQDAVSRGFVTLVLTVDNPDDECTATSAEVRITIVKTDCGDFPWDGH